MIKLSVTETSFVITRDAIVLSGDSFTPKHNDTSLNIYDNLLKGIFKTKDLVLPDDLLIIELDKPRIYKSLVKMKSSKKYAYKLLDVFKAIDMLNCRYRFVCTKKSFIHRLTLEKRNVQVSNFDMD